MSATATIRAGISYHNADLYHLMGLGVGDPAAYLQVTDESGATRTILIIRDVELDRAREVCTADEINAPAPYTPEGGLSADREVATAQATAECLHRNGVSEVRGDRSLPLSFVHVLGEAGLQVSCDLDLGGSLDNLLLHTQCFNGFQFFIFAHSQSTHTYSCIQEQRH